MEHGGTLMLSPIALVVFVAVCSGVCYFIARKRKAKLSFWIAMGALFGPFAIPLVFFAKPEVEATNTE